jgi:hypothetical protein
MNGCDGYMYITFSAGSLKYLPADGPLRYMYAVAAGELATTNTVRRDKTETDLRGTGQIRDDEEKDTQKIQK